jgi:hypothetical protein
MLIQLGRGPDWKWDNGCGINASDAQGTYHKFVKTTPNPRATKKSNGELVGELLLLLVGGVVAVAVGCAVAVSMSPVVMEAMMDYCAEGGEWASRRKMAARLQLAARAWKYAVGGPRRDV